MLAHADLVGKKVVVCDLDNTLWKGEIGEGKVEHFLDAQRTLKELRKKGVLLTVNSKNDPRNVHWRGAALSPDRLRRHPDQLGLQGRRTCGALKRRST